MTTGKRLFLQWSLFMCLVAIGAFIAANLGWVGYVRNDPTHITYFTLVVFCLATLWLGKISWRFSNGDDPEELEHALEHGWFASSLCVSIGLIGTAVGYYIMLKNGVGSGDPSDVVRRAFGDTSIAIINTVFGAVCGVIVEVQSHFIGHNVKKAANLVRKAAETAAAREALEKAIEERITQRILAQQARSETSPTPAKPEPAKEGQP